MSKQAIELQRPHRHAGRDYQPGQAQDAAKAPAAPGATTSRARCCACRRTRPNG